MGWLLALLTNKLAGPIGAAGCVILAVALGLSQVQAHGLAHDLTAARAERDTANQNLGTCRGNLTTLQSAIDRQNASLSAVEAESARRTAEAEKAVQAAAVAADGYRKRAGALLSRPPVGGDTCQRVLDVDRRVLEGLE